MGLNRAEDIHLQEQIDKKELRITIEINVTIQVHLPNETKVLPMRIAYLAERATKNLSVLHFLLDSRFLLCYLFWPWKKSWSYRDER